MDDRDISTTIPLITEPVHIRRARLYPFPDLKRLWLRVDLSPFIQPPNLEVIVRDPEGRVATSMYIVEWREPRLSLTLHLRIPPQEGGHYVAELILTEKEEKVLDRKEVPFELTFVEPEPEDLNPSSA